MPPRDRFALACRVLAVLIPLTAPAAVVAVEVTVKESSFALDGKPTFLLGCSYYAGLGASEDTLRRDLDAMQQHGFNWVRVWATWAAFDHDVSAVDRLTGEPTPRYMANLNRLIAECDRRSMVVNVTLSRGNGATGPERLQGIRPHRKAVESLCRALAEHRNWYLDLSNERNIKDKRFTPFEDLSQLRDIAKAQDPTRLVTASHAGDPTRQEVEQYLRTVRVDFLSIHRPRDAQSPALTAAKTKQVLGWIRQIGQPVPLHYDEPFRRGFGDWEPTAPDFLTDLQAARESGAAGWCFHNGHEKNGPANQPRRSFDLREKGLFDQLDGEERKFLAALKAGATPAPAAAPEPAPPPF
jgi:hypothetical protein